MPVFHLEKGNIQMEVLIAETEDAVKARAKIHRIGDQIAEPGIGDRFIGGTGDGAAEMKQPGTADLPDAGTVPVTQRDIGEISFAQMSRYDEIRIGIDPAGFLGGRPQFGQGETFRRIPIRHDGQLDLHRFSVRFDEFLEKLPGMVQFLLKTALVVIPGNCGMVLIQETAEHASEQFALVAHSTLDQGMDFAGAVGGTAGCIGGPDVENPLLEFMFAAGGADMRQLGKTFDRKNDILLAVHHRTFQREFDLGIGKAVDESADLGRVEGLQFLIGESGEKGRFSGIVLTDADNHIPAFGIGQGHAVAGEFGPSGAGKFVPVLGGLVIQFIGFHSAFDDLFPIHISAPGPIVFYMGSSASSLFKLASQRSRKFPQADGSTNASRSPAIRR